MEHLYYIYIYLYFPPVVEISLEKYPPQLHYRQIGMVTRIYRNLTKRKKQRTPLRSPVVGDERGGKHGIRYPEVAEKFFSKVLRFSRIFRFGGHCILKNAVLSTGCYSIMGQNMGQTVLRKNEEFFFELFDL